MQNNTPPQNLQAERAVLGACLLSYEALSTTAEILKPEDFYDISNRTMYEIISSMYASDKAVDLVTALDEMNKRGVHDRLGGQPYIAELISDVTHVALVGHYVKIVHEYSLRRRLLEASYKISSLAYKYTSEGREIIDETEKIIFEAVEDKSTSYPIGLNELAAPVFEKIKDAYQNGVKKFTGYSSGFDDLDRIVSGFQPGSLNIIAARPSMGKTVLAMNIAQFGGGGSSNPYVLIFSLEMTAEQLVQRMFAAQAGVSVSDMNRGAINEDDFYRLTEAAEILNNRNIYINDSSELSAVDLRVKCRRFKTRYPDLALIIVDYLQLMHSTNKRNDNRQQEVAEISRLLKAVAIELDCPVIALSQLSRDTERRSEKKPQLWDLRDSGAIEQDADTVILMYREDYYGDNENNNLQDSKAELRIAKNRNGSTGTCNLTFRREYTKFENYAKDC